MKFTPIFEKLGLNNKDSLIYFTLIKLGVKGATVFELIEKLDNKIKRTTIYSILKKLMILGAIEEVLKPDSLVNIKCFRAISPKTFFSLYFQRKKEELKEIETYQEIFDDELEMLYSIPKKIDLSDLDPIIQPYIQNFIKKKWKIMNYNQRENDPIFQYSIYECYLQPTHTQIFNVVPFHIFKFNYNISEDKNALEFTIKSIKMQSRELIGIYGNIKDFQLKDFQYEYSNLQFPAFTIEIKVNEIKKHPLFQKFQTFLNLDDKNLPESIQFGIGISIIINDVIFFFWAESESIINEVIQITINLNKQHFKFK